MLDYLIINGKYPDFETGEFKEANIGISQGKIAFIGAELQQAAEIIDAAGKVVSPGFIDIHMHEEWFGEEGEQYIVSKYMLGQGVTTCVGGNCGLMHQPAKVFRDTIAKLGGSPVNYMLLSGYNYYRTQLGYGHYEPTKPEDCEKIYERIREDVAEGVCGISFGLEYDPGITYEDMVNTAKALEGDDLMIAIHYRADRSKGLGNLQELIDLQETTNKKVQFSHLGSCMALGNTKAALDMMNEYMEKNPRFSFDTYPYDAFSSRIGSAVFDGNCPEKWGKKYEDIMMTGEPYKNVRCTKEIFEDCRENYPDMYAVAFVMDSEGISAAVANPKGMIASDGILKDGNGHPRAAGTFPRVFSKFVREDKVISLMDAIRKVTLEPAKRLMIDDRKGMVRAGWDADLTIFDPETIQDGPDFSDITIKSKGIDYVFINGQIAARDCEIVNERLGVFIPYNK